MPNLQQHDRMLLQIAEHARKHGISERDGTVHQVWSDKGEQKIRVVMGTKQDGSPWLSPWLHTEDHRGPHRQEEKYRVGMNVKISAVGGDFRQAKVTPTAENKKHPGPDHADEKHHTYQHDTVRERHGPDFQEHWIAKESTDPEGSGSKLKDPDNDSVVLVRAGDKPQDSSDQGKPWDGPPTHGGKPKGNYLIKAKDKIVFQVGNSTITLTPDKIQHSSTVVESKATQDVLNTAQKNITNTAQETIHNDVPQGEFKVTSETTINQGTPTGWDATG